VLCNGTKAQALEMKEELKNVLHHLGLTLSEAKTKVTHITEGFTFLGYQIIRKVGGRGTMAPHVLIPDSASQRFRHHVRRILSPTSTREATTAKIHASIASHGGGVNTTDVQVVPQISSATLVMNLSGT
jgi:RNA-directed DNA polymerase